MPSTPTPAFARTCSSTAWMDLIVMIEREFGFRVDEKRLMRLRTVGEVYEYVREACVEQAAAPKPVTTLAVEPPADL
jgi:hypothetical protein